MLSAEQVAERLHSQLAVSMRPSWVAECMAFLNAKHTDLDSWSEEQTLQAVFGQFLMCDLNAAGQGVLPEGATDMHKATLEGKYVLQVDEVVNIAAPARDRYTPDADGGSRMLKLHMTDGAQRIFGIEMQPIKALSWQKEAGTKVLVHDVPMRKGVMLLRPHNIVVLGGQVERLESARQQAVACWNKPPGGRRQGDPPRDIFGEARAAAWQQQQQQPGAAGAAAPATGTVAQGATGQGPRGPAQGAGVSGGPLGPAPALPGQVPAAAAGGQGQGYGNGLRQGQGQGPGLGQEQAAHGAMGSYRGLTLQVQPVPPGAAPGWQGPATAAAARPGVGAGIVQPQVVQPTPQQLGQGHAQPHGQSGEQAGRLMPPPAWGGVQDRGGGAGMAGAVGGQGPALLQGGMQQQVRQRQQQQQQPQQQQQQLGHQPSTGWQGQPALSVQLWEGAGAAPPALGMARPAPMQSGTAMPGYHGAGQAGTGPALHVESHQQQQQGHQPVKAAHLGGAPSDMPPPAMQQQQQWRQTGGQGLGAACDEEREWEEEEEDWPFEEPDLPSSSAQAWTASGAASNRPQPRPRGDMPPPALPTAGVVPQLPAAVRRYQALSSQASVAQVRQAPGHQDQQQQGLSVHQQGLSVQQQGLSAQQQVGEQQGGRWARSACNPPLEDADLPVVLVIDDEDDGQQQQPQQGPLQQQQQRLGSAQGGNVGTGADDAAPGAVALQRPGSAAAERSMGFEEAELSISGDEEDQQQQEPRLRRQNQPCGQGQNEDGVHGVQGDMPDHGDVTGPPSQACSPDFVVQDSYAGSGQHGSTPSPSCLPDAAHAPGFTSATTRGKAASSSPGSEVHQLGGACPRSNPGSRIKPEPDQITHADSSQTTGLDPDAALAAAVKEELPQHGAKGSVANLRSSRAGRGADLDADLDADVDAVIYRRKSAGGGVGGQALLGQGQGSGEMEGVKVWEEEEDCVPCTIKRGWDGDGAAAASPAGAPGQPKRPRLVVSAATVKQEQISIMDIKLEEVDEEVEVEEVGVAYPPAAAPGVGDVKVEPCVQDQGPEMRFGSPDSLQDIGRGAGKENDAPGGRVLLAPAAVSKGVLQCHTAATLRPALQAASGLYGAEARAPLNDQQQQQQRQGPGQRWVQGQVQQQEQQQAHLQQQQGQGWMDPPLHTHGCGWAQGEGQHQEQGWVQQQPLQWRKPLQQQGGPVASSAAPAGQEPQQQLWQQPPLHQQQQQALQHGQQHRQQALQQQQQHRQQAFPPQQHQHRQQDQQHWQQQQQQRQASRDVIEIHDGEDEPLPTRGSERALPTPSSLAPWHHTAPGQGQGQGKTQAGPGALALGGSSALGQGRGQAQAPASASTYDRPPFMYLAKVQSQLQATGQPWQATVCATFHSTIVAHGSTSYLIEDGTASVSASMADEAQMSLFGGRTLQQIQEQANHGDPQLQAEAQALASRGAKELRDFYGAMHLHGQGPGEVCIVRLIPLRSPAQLQQLLGGMPWGSTSQDV